MNTYPSQDQEMENIEAQIERKVTKAMTRIVTVALQALIVFVMTIIVLRFVWAWVIPDIMPGAVLVGFITPQLSWGTAAKLALLAATLTGINDSFKEAFKA